MGDKKQNSLHTKLYTKLFKGYVCFIISVDHIEIFK